MPHADDLQRILTEPLSYLHPQRLTVPAGFEGGEARDVLNRILLDGLALQESWPSTALTAVATQWVRHWRELPYIATLMGAYRLMPDLARGASLLRLPMPVRQFASCGLGARGPLAPEAFPVCVEQVEAAGLNALWGWHSHVPPLLLERLPLQFSEPVVRLHRQWPVTEPDTALFFMAVQHARRYPNTD
jgi:type III secretion system OrgA/MxiK family protein